MADKLEHITTFNIGDKTYAVSALSAETKDLLRTYMSIEDDIVANKMALLKSQHALASCSNMFLEALKEVEPLDLKAIAEHQAAAAMAADIAKQRQSDAANGPKPKARPKKASA